MKFSQLTKIHKPIQVWYGIVLKLGSETEYLRDKIKMIDHQFLLQFFMLNKFRNNPLLSKFANFNQV